MYHSSDGGSGAASTSEIRTRLGDIVDGEQGVGIDASSAVLESTGSDCRIPYVSSPSSRPSSTATSADNRKNLGINSTNRGLPDEQVSPTCSCLPSAVVHFDFLRRTLPFMSG